MYVRHKFWFEDNQLSPLEKFSNSESNGNHNSWKICYTQLYFSKVSLSNGKNAEIWSKKTKKNVKVGGESSFQSKSIHFLAKYVIVINILHFFLSNWRSSVCFNKFKLGLKSNFVSRTVCVISLLMTWGLLQLPAHLNQDFFCFWKREKEKFTL